MLETRWKGAEQGSEGRDSPSLTGEPNGIRARLTVRLQWGWGGGKGSLGPAVSKEGLAGQDEDF